VIELIEDAANGGKRIVGLGFISSADIGILSVGNGAGKFPIALVAPRFESLPGHAASGQAGLGVFISHGGVGT